LPAPADHVAGGAPSDSLPAPSAAVAADAGPRRLRLSTILIQLDAQGRPESSVAASDQATSASDARAGATRHRRRKPKVRSNLTLGEIFDRTAHAGFGFLIAFLALIAIPPIGLSFLCGPAIAFAGVQMIAGRERPWLPQRLRRHVVTVRTLEWLSQKVARWTRGLEWLIKPRLTVLGRGPFWTLIGFGIMLEGLGLALPLPVPGSNWFFTFPILFYSIGLLEDDGVLMLIGHLFAAAHVVLAILFWHVIYNAVADAVRWISG
jgi:hypothetical protein